jgi:hypothetical protein
VFPVPPFAEAAETVFVKVPVAEPVTSTVTVQEAPAARDAALKLTWVALSVAVELPLHVFPAPVKPVTVRETGTVSVNVTVPRANVLTAGLVTVRVSTDDAGDGLIKAGVNVFVIAGGANTAMPAGIAGTPVRGMLTPVPSSKFAVGALVATVLFPAVVPVTFKVNVQLELRGRV